MSIKEVSRYEMIKTINESGDPKKVIEISTADSTSKLRAFMYYDNEDSLSIAEVDTELRDDDHISNILNQADRMNYDSEILCYEYPWLPDHDVVVDFVRGNAVYVICGDVTISEIRQKFGYEDEIYLYLK